MRTLAFLATPALLLTLAWSPPLLGQVTDAERAAARELFKEGDDLQRAGKMAEALDKFQRAQKVYSAPTNELRIAQCQAALGKLAESAESYRTVLRMPLPAGSPPAFQAAAEQAKTELAQVEPRVPKLVVQVAPANANPQLLIDGQSVSAALVGEPLPLDPGTHRVRVVAQGFSSSDQDAILRERETTTVVATLKPLAPLAPSSSPPLPPPPPPTVAPPPPATGSVQEPGVPPPYIPPPPPRIADGEGAPQRKPSRLGVLFGGHLGYELAGGAFPLDAGRVDAPAVAGGGAAYGLEGGLRFARQWYVGLMVEHAEFAHGDLSATPAVTDASSSSWVLAAMLGFVVNPDRASFYGEIGAATRWFSFTETLGLRGQRNGNYNAGELDLGVGLWLPLGSSVRLVPKVTLDLGAFDTTTAGPNSQGHSFVMLGLEGLYNLDF
jgi:hypothetical protein